MKFLKNLQHVLTAFWQSLWKDRKVDNDDDEDDFFDFLNDKTKQIIWEKEKYKK